MIRNIDNCEVSSKDGEYGGASGLKEGVIIDNAAWLVKYPKNASNLKRHEEMEYTNDPVSEYIGSHIYGILGYPVHETMLVERNNKICVACKDFCTDGKRLVEIRTLKNTANNDLAEILERDFNNTGSSRIVIFEEICLHLKHNRLLNKVDGIIERFYDQIVIDAFINNSDRNNGNWGILRQEGKKDVLAPIYDNGGSMNGKTPDSRIEKTLNRPNGVVDNIFNGVSVFGYKNEVGEEQNYLVKNLIMLDSADLRNSLLKIVPIIGENMDRILKVIDELDDRACSPIRKEFYKQSLVCRYEHILLPAYKKAYSKTDEETEEQDSLDGR